MSAKQNAKIVVRLYGAPRAKFGPSIVVATNPAKSAPAAIAAGVGVRRKRAA